MRFGVDLFLSSLGVTERSLRKEATDDERGVFVPPGVEDRALGVLYVVRDGEDSIREVGCRVGVLPMSFATFLFESLGFTPTLCGVPVGFFAPATVSTEGTAMSGSRSILRDSEGEVFLDWTGLFDHGRCDCVLAREPWMVQPENNKSTPQRHLHFRGRVLEAASGSNSRVLQTLPNLSTQRHLSQISRSQTKKFRTSTLSSST